MENLVVALEPVQFFACGLGFLCGILLATLFVKGWD